MQKTIITLSIILIGSIVANTSHAWTQAGKFRDWGVAVNDKNCAAWTLSKKSNTKTEMIVLFAKGQNTADVHFKIPNLLSKYQLKKVKLEVLGAKYDYQLNITEPSIASSTPANKKLIISAFRKGSDVKSNWSINDGKNRSSSFSLMGFTAAFLKAAEKCGAEKFALTTAPGNQANSKKLALTTAPENQSSIKKLANNNPTPIQFIQDVLPELNSSQKRIILRQLNIHTKLRANLSTANISKIYLKDTSKLINPFKEYSKKFMAPSYAFHLINDKDSAERFLISILDQSERENQEELERKKKAEQERLARKKKAEQEKLAREKKAKDEFSEKLKAHELKLNDKNRIGFRDFYIGMDADIHTYIKYGNVKIEKINFKNKDGEKCTWISKVKPIGLSCYGLDYRFEFDNGIKEKSELNKIRIYILNYVQSSSYIGNLFNMGTSEDPVVNLINSLNKKYKRSYSYSENERLLFNDGETDELYIAYEDGQIIFSLERVDDGSYDTDIYAYITYRNKSDGLKFLDAIKPKTAISDF